MTPLRRAFVIASVAWSIGLLLAPAIAARTQTGAAGAGDAVALVLYAAGSLICHQRPERSFHLFGVQLPVCARCAGIYLGAAVTACLAWARMAPAAPDHHRGSPARDARPRPRTLLLFSAVPMMATLVYEWTTGQTPGNMARAMSGATLGAAVAWIVCSVR